MSPKLIRGNTPDRRDRRDYALSAVRENILNGNYLQSIIDTHVGHVGPHGTTFSWPQFRRATVIPFSVAAGSRFLRLLALLCGRSVCIAALLPNFWHHSRIFISRAESNTARGSVLTVEQPRLPSGPLHCSASEPGSSKLPGNHRSRCSCRRRPDWLSARQRRQHPSPRTSSLPRLAPRPLCGIQLKESPHEHR